MAESLKDQPPLALDLIFTISNRMQPLGFKQATFRLVRIATYHHTTQLLVIAYMMSSICTHIYIQIL
jgi:hypothetical protein